MFKKIFAVICLVAVCTVAAIAAFSCFRQPVPSEIKTANHEDACFLLENLAEAEIIYEANKGIKRKQRFTNDFNALSAFASEKSIRAIKADGKASTPYGGYLLYLSEKTPGDKFRTDFLITAKPAPGYHGPILQISKDKKIITKGE